VQHERRKRLTDDHSEGKRDGSYQTQDGDRPVSLFTFGKGPYGDITAGSSEVTITSSKLLESPTENEKGRTRFRTTHYELGMVIAAPIPWIARRIKKAIGSFTTRAHVTVQSTC
jgi:hypothetical protein